MKIKVCCISSIKEAQIAIEAGADVLGLVGDMPSGPGIISDELARDIAAAVPKHIETFLLASETTATDIIKHHQRVKSSALQLVDALTAGSYAEIKQSLPGVKLVQVIHVLNEESIQQALDVAGHVDAILLDSGNPNLTVKELGGTGRTHNWDLSKRIVTAVSVPVYLAGGLCAENVRDAISQVQPYGLDLCSGVRTDDQLDQAKLKAFVAAVRK